MNERPIVTLESIIYDALDDGEVRTPRERCAKCRHIARLYGVRVPCDGEPVCAIDPLPEEAANE